MLSSLCLLLLFLLIPALIHQHQHISGAQFFLAFAWRDKIEGQKKFLNFYLRSETKSINFWIIYNRISRLEGILKVHLSLDHSRYVIIQSRFLHLSQERICFWSSLFSLGWGGGWGRWGGLYMVFPHIKEKFVCCSYLPTLLNLPPWIQTENV